jgi:hypothetical protein
VPARKQPVRIDKGYSTFPRYPHFKTERRIKLPPIPKRPVMFQERSLIHYQELNKDPLWLVIHRRGPAREQLGGNPLEMRATSKELIRGTLPERILYKYLTELMHFDPMVDFSYQSSLQGGRIDTGGIVADFMFPYLMLILSVLGPTHTEYIRIQKDNEQNMSLAEMGYQVYEIEEEDIYDESRFDAIMKKIFNWTHSGGGDTIPDQDMVSTVDGFRMDYVYQSIRQIQAVLP